MLAVTLEVLSKIRSFPSTSYEVRRATTDSFGRRSRKNSHTRMAANTSATEVPTMLNHNVTVAWSIHATRCATGGTGSWNRPNELIAPKKGSQSLTRVLRNEIRARPPQGSARASPRGRSRRARLGIMISAAGIVIGWFELFWQQ